MPIGYLFTAALMAACVLAALAPPRDWSPLGWVAFISGFTVNELPFLALYYLAGSTVMAAGQSRLDSPAGWAGIVLACAAAAGLGVIVRRALRAGPVLDRALRAGLGADRGPRAGLGVDRGPRASLGVDRASADGPGRLGRLGRLGDGGAARRLAWFRILAWPFPFPPRAGVERIANLSYGPAGAANRLDVFRHRDTTGPAPVFIHFHGGMLARGRKNREALPLLYRLAALGWVCVSANYRLRPRTRFPGHLIDVKRVIAWAREHGGEYGGDGRTVVLSGTSSGAQLAALAAATAGDPRFQPGFEGADTSVGAVVCLSGFYGFPGTLAQQPWSPLAQDLTGAPPFLVVHGANDSVVPVRYARLFAERLRHQSPTTVVYAELPGAQHSFDRYYSPRFEAVASAVEVFVTQVTSASTRRGRPMS